MASVGGRDWRLLDIYFDNGQEKMSTRIWLDVGHAYEPRRWTSGGAVGQDWRVWVRGIAGADISAFVGKVVFQLRPDTQFRCPEREYLEPPYQIQEAGSAPTEVHIKVYLKYTTKPEQINLKYGPLIMNSAQSNADSQCVHYDVRNPSEQLQMALMKSKPSRPQNNSVLVVLPNTGAVCPQWSLPKTTKRKRYEFVEPIESKPSFKKCTKMTLLKKCLKRQQSRLDNKYRLYKGSSP